MKILLDALVYDQHNWRICGDLKLKNIIAVCEDKLQGYTAFNLYLRLCEQYKLEKISWKCDPFLQMIILVTEHEGKFKVFLPLHFTYRPTPKWIRETTAHIKELQPQASFHLAFSSSSQTFVMYRTSSGFEMPKNQTLKELQKTQTGTDTSIETDET